MNLCECSKVFNSVSHYVNKLLHFVLSVLAIIMLEIEILRHDLLEHSHIDHMTQLNPFLPHLFVDSLTL